MISRNQLLAGAAAVCAVLAPSAAGAGGVLAITDPQVPEYARALAEVRRSLGREVVTLAPEAAAPERLAALAPELVLAVGQAALAAAQHAPPRVPVVYLMVLERLAPPSPRVTGVPLEVSVADQLAHFKRIHPTMRTLGTLHAPDGSATFVARAREAARAQGLVLVSREARDPQTAAAALTRLSSEVDAIWLPADPRLVTGALFRYARDLTLKRGIALFGFLEGFTAAGALASVSPDVRQIGAEAARLARDLLARSPEARLPVPAAAFARGSLSLHAGCASLLGIELEEETLADAARVYR